VKLQQDLGTGLQTLKKEENKLVPTAYSDTKYNFSVGKSLEGFNYK